MLLKSCRNIYKQLQDVDEKKDPVAAAFKLDKRRRRGKSRIEQAISQQKCIPTDKGQSQFFTFLLTYK